MPRRVGFCSAPIPFADTRRAVSNHHSIYGRRISRKSSGDVIILETIIAYNTNFVPYGRFAPLTNISTLAEYSHYPNNIQF
jgi:hypothetical protein